MEYTDIKKLIEDMGESKLDSLEIEFADGVKINMTKNGIKNTETVIAASAPITPPTVVPNKETSLVETKTSEEKIETYKIVKSPMVGTFYGNSLSKKEPFVKIGDKVNKGQVICIVEAMKLMNEIESEFDGNIVEICVNDGDIVEYGMPLFKIK